MLPIRSLLPALSLGLFLVACGDSRTVPVGGRDEPEPPATPADPEQVEPDPVKQPECAKVTSEDPLVVVTDRGPVRGFQGRETANFLGIPFAKPPVGAGRFKAPEAPGCWNTMLYATDYAPQCAQPGADGTFAGSEDCLYLNVWSPHGARPGTKPVLFWIHGGANVFGSANQALPSGKNLYDGERLARENDVVVVSINYRLGALGFLAHDALSAESTPRSSGNYATLDQLRALEWVKANVARFGGDPARVMIFGESAGALNTCVLLVSPLARGLFSSALMQSGECGARPLVDAEARGRDFAAELGCTSGDVAACLREVPIPALLAAPTRASDATKGWDLPWASNVDGWVLPKLPLEAIREGTHHHVPFVVGSNADEMELFIPSGTINSCPEYAALIATMLPDHASQVLAEYPCGDFPVPRWAAIAALTDLTFTCPARRIARAAAAAQSEPVHRYFYTHGRDYGPMAPLRAFHAAELPFVFDSFAAEPYAPTTGEAGLSRNIQRYWSQLARIGDPNQTGAMSWPRYRRDDERALVLDATLSVSSSVRGARCDFWDTITTH